MTIQLKYPIFFKRVNGTWMGIAMGEHAREYSNMLRLNDMSYDVAKHLNEPIEREELTRRVMAEYEGSEGEVNQTIEQVLKQLREAGLL